MEKELDYYYIDNIHYGGNQEWADHYMMRLGGCSTVCVCDVCVYLAKKFPSLKNLYPYDPFNVTKQDFLNFFKLMYKFVYPGIKGLSNILKFEKKLRNYLSITNTKTKIDSFSGSKNVENAKIWIKEKINANLPIMYLLLSHKNKKLEDFHWHWFTLTGYSEQNNIFFVTAGTYGEKYILDLNALWDTGYEQKGGMVCIAPA